MSDQRRILAVDFDGTICEDAFPEIGAPREAVIAAMRDLHHRGWKIIIHTCRANQGPVAEGDSAKNRFARLREMLDWLRRHAVPFDKVWGLKLCGPALIEDAPNEIGKPAADVYWDDRALNVNAEQTRLVDVTEIIAAQR